MNIIKNIIDDYEQLIRTKIKIPLDNGDIITFAFHIEDLPHLLGLQHLTDIPVLFEYSKKRISATDLYNQMCDDTIDTNTFEESTYFEELYEKRIKYFTTEIIFDILHAKQIVHFNAVLVKNFSTKLDKIEYMFWKRYKDENNQYGYFGIGFMSSGNETDINYPNTFFFRLDDAYICNQKIVIPLSFMKKDKNRNTTFEIYWNEIWKTLRKNKHYKKLKEYQLEDGRIDEKKIKNCNDEKLLKHYELLQLDIFDKIYLPYMKEDFKWTNNEKRFILIKMKEKKYDLKPNEIIHLLMEYKQSIKKDNEKK